MADIIVISPKMFLEQKQNQIKDSILKKYQEIFTRHTCFSLIKSDSIPFHCNTSRNSQFFKRPIVTTVAIKKKDPRKVFVGILNVINKTNYSKILTRIKKDFISPQDISYTIQTIIKTCYKDTFYLQIHIQLLHDIISYLKEGVEIIYKILQEFADEFQAKKEWTKLSIEDQGKGYLEFCDKQKWKGLIISKNIVLMEFVKHFKLNIDVIKHTQTLENDLLELLNEDDQDGITVVITMLIDIAKINIIYVKDIQIGELFSLVSSKKNIFILEDLARFINQNKGEYDRIFSKPSSKLIGGMYGSLNDDISF